MHLPRKVRLHQRPAVEVRPVRVRHLVHLVGKRADEDLVVGVVPVQGLGDGVEGPQVLEVKQQARRDLLKSRVEDTYESYDSYEWLDAKKV